jgi:hypothetical protein
MAKFKLQTSAKYKYLDVKNLIAYAGEVEF